MVVRGQAAPYLEPAGSAGRVSVRRAPKGGAARERWRAGGVRFRSGGGGARALIYGRKTERTCVIRDETEAAAAVPALRPIISR